MTPLRWVIADISRQRIGHIFKGRNVTNICFTQLSITHNTPDARINVCEYLVCDWWLSNTRICNLIHHRGYSISRRSKDNFSWTIRPLKMGLLCFFETSGNKYPVKLSPITQERMSHPHGCEILKSRRCTDSYSPLIGIPSCIILILQIS